jgi:succinate dehydrogenase / fumarate reductase flavoprotein subunit
MDRLPGIRQIAVDFAGVDPISEPIPIQPAQHYSMGGIPTNADGETPLPGLYAAGECACVSVHGANRLGGNSLLETLVFGAKAGKKAALNINEEKESFNPKAFKKESDAFHSSFREFSSRKKGEFCFRLRDNLKTVMTHQVGIFRKEADLLSAREKIRELKQGLEHLSILQKGLKFNNEWIQFLELEGMLHVAETIVEGALARKESRGSHFRTDYPERDDKHWLRHTLAYKTSDGCRLEYKEVKITNYPPKARTY